MLCLVLAVDSFTPLSVSGDFRAKKKRPPLRNKYAVMDAIVLILSLQPPLAGSTGELFFNTEEAIPVPVLQIPHLSVKSTA